MNRVIKSNSRGRKTREVNHPHSTIILRQGNNCIVPNINYLSIKHAVGDRSREDVELYPAGRQNDIDAKKHISRTMAWNRRTNGMRQQCILGDHSAEAKWAISFLKPVFPSC